MFLLFSGSKARESVINNIIVLPLRPLGNRIKNFRVDFGVL